MTTSPDTALRRSEDPDGAMDAVAHLMFGPVPAKGQRHDALVELAYRAAEAGQSNDWILIALNTAADMWGKPAGPYARWTALLGLLRMARAMYPNSQDGSGWRPAARSAGNAEAVTA